MVDIINSDNIKIIINIGSWILVGITYYKLFDSYLGFIPFVGNIILIVKIADIYDNPYKKEYIIVSILYYGCVFLFTLLSVLLLIGGLASGALAESAFGSAAMFFILIVLLILILLINYTYKIIRPMIEDIEQRQDVTVIAVLLAIFQSFFYIYLLINLDKIGENCGVCSQADQLDNQDYQDQQGTPPQDQTTYYQTHEDSDGIYKVEDEQDDIYNPYDE